MLVVGNLAVQKAERSVQPVQPPLAPAAPIDRASLQGLRWDDLRIFLDVSESRSFRSAAVKARVAINTVRARVERLEDRIGEQLLRREARGVSLTPTGLQLRRIALGMKGVAVTDGFVQRAYLRKSDELRIGTSEGLGSGWLTPRLLDLQGTVPDVTISLMCDNDLETDRSEDLDIGVTWQIPRNPDLVVAKLATIHFMPFASRDYVKRFGKPTSPEELLEHRFIEQSAPGIKSDLLDQLVGTERPSGFLSMRTNSSLAVFWAVANGIGIAFMPTYAPALVNKLEPIDLLFQPKFDLFYYFHPEARNAPIVMAGIDWLKSCFDKARYPWFRPDFVHPSRFTERRHDNVVPLFSSLVD
jgi:DNA-binding transcriptional LysR family regulator